MLSARNGRNVKLVLFLCFVSSFAHADMFGLDYNVGQNSKPTYGVDYQIGSGIPYIDIAVSSNYDYLSPYVSFGLQGDTINLGLGSAINIDRYNGNTTPVFGPELGFMKNLTPLVYVKENSTLLTDLYGNTNFGATVSLGWNL